jgi:ubiquitin-like-conjugating enzyme ATG10
LQFNTRYLRITRHIPAGSLASKDTRDSQTAGEEDAIEDDDPEALVAPVARHEHMRVVQCDIAYSPSYQVPVLYLTFVERPTNRSVPLPSPNEVFDILVPDDFKSAMRSVGVMGALSMAEHPINGVPAYFVHPCRTQEVMSPLLQNVDSIKPEFNSPKAMNYLMLWLGVIGASVGLSVPINVARLFADGNGEALAELGKC